MGTTVFEIAGGPADPSPQPWYKVWVPKDLVQEGLTYPKIFQCDNGSGFKVEVTKMLDMHEVIIRHITAKFKHTHTSFVEALNKIFAMELFKVHDAQELNDPEKVSSTWVKHLYGLTDNLVIRKCK